MPSRIRSERILAARTAAYESWAKTEDRTARTAAARDAFRSSFERQVDPDGVLTNAERTRRAEALRKAHYTRLALASVRARARRRAS